MAIAWLSYAWDDNKSDDVEYIASELVSHGLDIKLDKWNLRAGHRLWPQIEKFIQDPKLSDAWILYVTENSLSSEACQEELSYALDRSLNVRGKSFPVIGLFPGPVNNEMIPAAIRTRLYVSLTDPNWKDRILGAAEGRSTSFGQREIPSYEISIYPRNPILNGKLTIEVRPRAATWCPCFAGIPIEEKEIISPSISFGPRGRIPVHSVLSMCGSQASDDGKWWLEYAGNECTPTQSLFVFCESLPTKLAFGVDRGKPQFLHEFTGSELG